ncbi:hypothetical protein L1987_22511 [Smallanthus sonchifolius]|uniref:Uncharacterized protein n=1 Tax=Smallanthus sonchifolius TaxID=185202 RepID=A0ACB9IEW4_9ASTR|nr:hypothetical protein L1987_22511 [Smallanthus sonchifolius]
MEIFAFVDSGSRSSCFIYVLKNDYCNRDSSSLLKAMVVPVWLYLVEVVIVSENAISDDVHLHQVRLEVPQPPLLPTVNHQAS